MGREASGSKNFPEKMSARVNTGGVEKPRACKENFSIFDKKFVHVPENLVLSQMGPTTLCRKVT